MTALRQFASDNYAGVPPAVLRALAEANVGHTPSYGRDPWTARAEQLFREHFGDETAVYLVFTGTAANVLGLQAVTRPYHAVICAAGAHIEVDECGAPERFAGSKLIVCPTPDGKLRPADIERQLEWLGDVHKVQPRVVSITQATELGTVYRPEEIRTLADTAHAHGLVLHLDGARIANAAVSLGAAFRRFTTDAGVDVVSFGGTKNGLLAAEAVLFLDGRGPEDFPFLRKQGMQLASKMRFLAAQFVALLGTDLWRTNAEHANRMARLLAAGVEAVPGIRLTQPVEAN
ncbi:MAG TPA: low specificity L-threonine aldolase, partial [Gemmatimonadales bacterium]|nr:low specificity L-threonine aldolase [Gemmatimonadales bacterium]